MDTRTKLKLRRDVQTAMQFLKDGQLDAARDAFVAMVEAHPDVTLGYIGLGQVHMQEGDPETALKYFQDALEIDPQSAMALNMSARAREKLGDIDGALEDYEEVGQLDPARGSSQIRMSRIFAKEGDLDEASTRLREALKRNPQQLAARFMLAGNLEKSGDIAGAKEELKRILEVNPQMGMAAYRLAMLQIRDKNYAEAEELLFTAIEQADDRPTPYATLGFVLRAQGKAEAALDAFEAAMELNPKSQPFALGAAECMVDLGRHDDALKTLRGALRGARQTGPIHKRMGDVYVAMERPEQALEEYRAALVGSPEFVAKHPDLPGMIDEPGDPKAKALKVKDYLANLAETQRESGTTERRFGGFRRNRNLRSFQATGA
ncbi:hypothetical protein ATO13_16059 [Stappia sp. 22II-S9-Z10]|nr:hypothetical protein ATO13_16059 [Stappia sp. 22II-S9-Z10]